jgi:hypothetical protein
MTASAKSTALTEGISVRYKITPALLATFLFFDELGFCGSTKVLYRVTPILSSSPMNPVWPDR